VGALAQAVFADVDLTAVAAIYGQARTPELVEFTRHVAFLAAGNTLRSVAQQYRTTPVPAAELRRAAEAIVGDEGEPEASEGSPPTSERGEPATDGLGRW
jgi:hypothetical protein